MTIGINKTRISINGSSRIYIYTPESGSRIARMIPTVTDEHDACRTVPIISRWLIVGRTCAAHTRWAAPKSRAGACRLRGWCMVRFCIWLIWLFPTQHNIDAHVRAGREANCDAYVRADISIDTLANRTTGMECIACYVECMLCACWKRFSGGFRCLQWYDIYIWLKM